MLKNFNIEGEPMRGPIALKIPGLAVTTSRDVLQPTPANTFHPQNNRHDVRGGLPGKASATGAVPKVCGSLEPAPFIQLLAEPVCAPVAGTSLLWDSNTENDLFLHKATGASSYRPATRKCSPRLPKHLRSRILIYVLLAINDDDVWITFAAFTGFAGMMIAWSGAVWGTRWSYSSYRWCGEFSPAHLLNPPTNGFAAWHDSYTGTFGRGADVYGPYGGAGGFAAYSPRTGSYVRGGAVYGPYGSRKGGPHAPITTQPGETTTTRGHESGNGIYPRSRLHWAGN